MLCVHKPVPLGAMLSTFVALQTVAHLPHVLAELNVVAMQDVNIAQPQALQAGSDAGAHTISAVVRILACKQASSSSSGSSRGLSLFACNGDACSECATLRHHTVAAATRVHMPCGNVTLLTEQQQRVEHCQQVTAMSCWLASASEVEAHLAHTCQFWCR
jgi:hypothetical protein